MRGIEKELIPQKDARQRKKIACEGHDNTSITKTLQGPRQCVNY